MSVRLKSLTVAPPGYFQFSIPKAGIKVARFNTFAEMRRRFIEISRSRPELGLPTDRNQVEEILNSENALRVSLIPNSEDWCIFSVDAPPVTPNPDQVCLVQLGRFGDVMIMLPAMRHIFDTTGIKPVVMIAREFSGVLDGVSYVEPWVLDGVHWIYGVRAAKDAADKYFKRVLVPKYWDCHGMAAPPSVQEKPLAQNPSKRQVVDSEEEWNSYAYSQWKACGFTRQQMIGWPLVFDRRDAAREAELCNTHLPAGKPVVLYNFSGFSNPMAAKDEVLNSVRQLGDRIQLVDLSGITAKRIFDLLGMYDRALCLITSDTATLHLAAAHEIPFVALQANGGGGSIIKGNCISKIRYSEIQSRAWEIPAAIERLL